MEKELEILKHIEELYSGDVDNEEIIRFSEKNTEKVAAWREAFAEYDLNDVFMAIDDFWQYNSNKTKPTVAKILAKLNAKNVSKHHKQNVQEFRYFSPSDALMERDIKLGCCRHLKNIYDQAVDYVLTDQLCREIPASEWQKMDISERYLQATAKGLFNDFDEVLKAICRQSYGKDYQFEGLAKETSGLEWWHN